MAKEDSLERRGSNVREGPGAWVVKRGKVGSDKCSDMIESGGRMEVSTVRIGPVSKLFFEKRKCVIIPEQSFGIRSTIVYIQTASLLFSKKEGSSAHARWSSYPFTLSPLRKRLVKCQR